MQIASTVTTEVFRPSKKGIDLFGNNLKLIYFNINR